MTSSNKESLEFIRKYKELCERYPTFEEKFMIYFEDRIIDYQKKIITADELDEKVVEFMNDFVCKSRNRKLKSILRKKE